MLLPEALAVGADTDDAQQVLCNLETMLSRHRVLQRFEFRRKEFDYLAALRTDHVIVMLMFVVVFVVRASVAKANFTREARFSEQFKRPVDSGLADGRIFLLHEPIEIFVGEMFFGTQKNIQNEVALRRALEPSFLDVFKKDFLFFG